jgi:type IV pilus assembly protein PilM
VNPEERKEPGVSGDTAAPPDAAGTGVSLSGRAEAVREPGRSKDGLPGAVRSISRFLSNPLRRGRRAILGLDIGTESIKMVLLRRSGKAIESVSPKIIRRPLATGGERGRVEDIIPIIHDAVREFRSEINTVVVSVQGPEVMVRRVEVPPMPRSELKSALPWVIDRFLPYSIEDAVYDHRVLGEKKGSGELELLVVVARKEFIDGLTGQLKKIGLPPSVVTVAPCALWNIVRHLGIEEGTIDVVINIGDRVTSINFFSTNRLEFSRDIMTAGDAITAALTGKVTYKGEEFAIPPKMAEELKCRYGIPMGDDLPEFTESGVPFASLQALIRPAVERLATEIDRSIKYASRAYGIENIRRILLTGGSARLLNLEEYLSASLGRPVEKLNPATRIEALRHTMNEGERAVFVRLGMSLTNCLGLALERGESLNLVPSGVTDIRRAVLEKKILRTAASLVLLVLAGTSLNMEVKRRIDLRKLEAAEATWNAIRSDPSYEEVRTLQEKMRSVERAVSQLSRHRDFTTAFLRDLTHRLPESVVLEELTLVQQAAQGKGAGEGGTDGAGAVEAASERRGPWKLGLEGRLRTSRALAEPTLSEIMIDLDRSPFLENPVLASLEEDGGGPDEGMTFYLKCGVVRASTGPL